LLLSLVAYLGVTALLIGTLALLRPRLLRVRSRRAGATFFVLGLLLTSIGVWWPARLHTSSGGTLLDRFIPEFQFRELHSTRVSATPQEVFRAIHAVTAGEIRFFRTLTWIRSPRLAGRRVQETILSPDWRMSILDVALRSGFVLLGEDWGKELVVGTVICCGRIRPQTAQGFRTLNAPSSIRAALNFRVELLPDHTSRLTTETRIVAIGGEARRRFGLYWSFIYPGSSLIRYGWLEAIRRRAEKLSTSFRSASATTTCTFLTAASAFPDQHRCTGPPLGLLS
jgi:hypothetical protein